MSLALHLWVTSERSAICPICRNTRSHARFASNTLIEEARTQSGICGSAFCALYVSLLLWSLHAV